MDPEPSFALAGRHDPANKEKPYDVHCGSGSAGVEDSVMDARVFPLAVGSLAPDFTLRHTPTTTLSLRRFTGRPAVLVFYPMVFEPVSEEQLTLYQEYLPEFEHLGAQLLGISTDHVWCNQSFARQARIQFPLLSDTSPSGGISRLYRVYREQMEVCARALFVVARDGIIRFSEAYPDLINPGADDVLTMLERMYGDGSETGGA